MTETKGVSDFFARSNFDRASSVMVQVSVLMRLLGVESVLEIGPGRGNTGTLLRSFGICYESVDTITTFGEPTYKEEFLRFETTKTYDVVAAFQVFEHSPREKLIEGFQKCTELSKKYVVISLPYSGNYMSFSFRAKLCDTNRIFSGLIDLQKVIRFPVFLPHRRSAWRHDGSGSGSARHQWEVGDRGSLVRDIVDEMSEAGLSCDEVFLNPYYPYHCFFVARVAK